MCQEQTIGSDDRVQGREADLLLARRASTGDAAASHQIVEAYAPRLFRLAHRLCRTTADAEDVLQETLMASLRSIGQFDGRSALATWMSRILIRQAGKVGRKSRRGPRLVEGVAEDAAVASSSAGEVDSRLDVASALPRLAQEHREVIVLRELERMSYAQIAEVLGIPQGTVESRLFRARADLRRLLGAYDPPA